METVTLDVDESGTKTQPPPNQFVQLINNENSENENNHN